jgi:hypothetical protein
MRNPAVAKAVFFANPTTWRFAEMSRHEDKSAHLTQNQNNAMSDDPGDGSRNSDTVGRDGKPTAAERAPDQDAQDREAVEAFGRAGAGKE